MVKKSKLTRTIIHPDGREETVVEEKEEEVDDDDKDRVLKEFEPDTKPAQFAGGALMTSTEVEPVSLTITEEGDSDFRLPGGQVEVVGGEVVTTTTTTSEVEHGDNVRIDVNGDDDDACASQEQTARGEKEESPVDLDSSREHTDSTDFSTSDSGAKPSEPLGASGAQVDQPARGGQGKGRGRRKKNRRR